MDSLKKVSCMLIQIILLSTSLHRTAALDIPSEYVLDVTHECGESEEDNPVVTIVTDLYIEARAECANGEFSFTNRSDVLYVLTGTNVASGEGCLFFNKQGDHQVEVSVGWGLPDLKLVADARRYTISCTFANYGGVDMETAEVQDGMIRPKELLINVGTGVPSTYITLELRDVKDQLITDAIPIDKHVRLVATTTGVYRNYQIRPVCCFAVGTKSKVRYAVLRSGCGDGIIFKKDEGFITDATSARSPYFTTFFVEKDQTVTYQCSFVICEDCSGVSLCL